MKSQRNQGTNTNKDVLLRFELSNENCLGVIWVFKKDVLENSSFSNTELSKSQHCRLHHVTTESVLGVV